MGNLSWNKVIKLIRQGKDEAVIDYNRGDSKDRYVKKLVKSYVELGEKEFIVDDNLIEMLNATDFTKKQIAKDAKPPYPVMLVRLTNKSVLVDESSSGVKYTVFDGHRYFEPIFVDERIILHSMSGAEKEAAKQIMQTIKVLLYVNSEGVDLWQDKSKEESIKKQLRRSKGGARKKLQAKLAKAKERSIYIVGGRLEPMPSEATGTGRKLDTRFTVRGHFKSQPCGKGKKERKRIWIMPYWKGPTFAEVVSRKYVVGLPS